MRRRILGGLALSLVVATCSHGMPSGRQTQEVRSEPQIITIRIHDYARVHPAILRQAKQAASGILGEIGVTTVWMECGSEPETHEGACDRPVTPLDFVVTVVPRSMSQRLRLRSGTFGVAAEPIGDGFGFFASVFYDDAKEFARRHQLEVGQVLATVIAHELGHLLLGTNSHSTRGLMSALWSGRELRAANQRGLTFSPGEIRRIRVNLTSRQAALSIFEEARRTPVANVGQD
jgi:hypothetical protein